MVKPRIIQFLESRGLRLSEEKTHITHITKGFDFLGWNFRKYASGKLLIKPSDKSIKAVLEKTGEVMRSNRQAKTVNLIEMLNPIIRGWANYHKHAVAKRIFGKVDSLIFEQLWHFVPNGGVPNYAKFGGSRAGLCPVCQQGFHGETSIHVHHIVERCNGGGDSLAVRWGRYPIYMPHYYVKLADAPASSHRCHCAIYAKAFKPHDSR